MILFRLFAEFFQIGLFSVGGGLATLPFLYRLADKYDWFDYTAIADMIAIAESTPGAIGVNMATYAGFHCAGIPGAVLATLGLVCPSIVVIIIVARLFLSFKDNPLVNAVFSGLRPAATGLIAAAGFAVISQSLYNKDSPVWYGGIRWRELILFALIFFLIRRFKKHPVIYIAAAGAAGVIFGF
ncbi:MAG: chromate transporter [Treponema sp.]|jgi:chromate transporter|nr:chromate transporter [Treponema sp.]